MLGCLWLQQSCPKFFCLLRSRSGKVRHNFQWISSTKRFLFTKHTSNILYKICGEMVWINKTVMKRYETHKVCQEDVNYGLVTLLFCSHLSDKHWKCAKTFQSGCTPLLPFSAIKYPDGFIPLLGCQTVSPPIYNLYNSKSPTLASSGGRY